MDKHITRSILEQEPPPTSDFVNRIRFCAKALAYGVLNDLWFPTIVIGAGSRWMTYSVGRDTTEYIHRFDAYFNLNTSKVTNIKCVWKEDYPNITFLQVFGYLTQLNQSSYMLTDKAFQLLETPLTPPKVFISYRRGVSTILGLLIEARLKAISDELNPFIDKELAIGQPWEAQLKKRVEACDTFISLIGSEDSFSENVLNEIRWAKEASKKIISIWHGDFTSIKPQLCPDPEVAKYLGDNHGIAVKGSQAIDYETAILLLENELHYF